MRVSARLFIGAALFFLFLFVVYASTASEPVGSTLLGLGSAACALVGVYLWLQVRRGGELAEDRPDARPEELAGPLVAVPAPSLWPVGVAFGAGTFSAGLVLGAWLALPGAVIMVASVVGVALAGRN